MAMRPRHSHTSQSARCMRPRRQRIAREGSVRDVCKELAKNVELCPDRKPWTQQPCEIPQNEPSERDQCGPRRFVYFSARTFEGPFAPEAGRSVRRGARPHRAVPRHNETDSSPHTLACPARISWAVGRPPLSQFAVSQEAVSDQGSPRPQSNRGILKPYPRGSNKQR